MKRLIVLAIVAIAAASLFIYQCKKSKQEQEWAKIQYLLDKGKGSSDVTPINTNKQKAIDDMNSTDRVMYDKIEKKLSEQGYDICSYNKASEKAAVDAIHEVDRRFTIGTKEHMKQSGKAMSESSALIRKKVGQTEDESAFIGMLVGMSDICK